MKINQTEIEKGTQAKVRLKIGYLPSGTDISIYAHVFRGMEDGKTGLVLAGVHGDEINGVETLRQLLEAGFFKNITKGTVIVVPLLNVFGFINFSRDVPDGKDVNRSFPGNQKGSLASRVARKLTKSILPLVDFAIDFHTGGDSRYNYPQIRFTGTDPAARELADVFRAPLTIPRPRIARSLRKVAGDMGIPVVVFEGGESRRLDALSIEEGKNGIRRVFEHFDMLPASDSESFHRESLLIEKSSWIRADEAGLFIWSKCAGNFVRKGEHLGVIQDIYGERSITVTARQNGFIIGHNNAPVVNSGDALFHIGYPVQKP